jgi:hypothetical protein
MVHVGHVLHLQMSNVGHLLQMVHISMHLPNEYKHVFTSGFKTKIRFTLNDRDFIRSCAYE